MTGPTATTARDLIANGACSAACLLAPDRSTRCSCRCGGVHHGALAEALVAGLETERTAA